MATRLEAKNNLLQGLPDISQEIKEVFGKYFEAVDDDRESADLFVKAWLAMSLNNGIGLYMKERFSPTSQASLISQRG